MSVIATKNVRWTRWLKIAAAVFLIVIIIFLSFGMIFYSFFKQDAINVAIDNMQTDADRVSMALDSTISDVLALYSGMAAEPSFMKNFSQMENTNEDDHFAKYQIRSRINSYLLTTANQNQVINSIYVYAKGLYTSHLDTSSFSDSQLQKTQWIEDVSRAVAAGEHWTTTYAFNADGDSTERVVAYCQRLISPSMANHRVYGYFSINLSISELSSTISLMTNPSNTYTILFDNGNRQITGVGSSAGLGDEQYHEIVTDCLAQGFAGTFLYSSKEHGELVVSLSPPISNGYYCASFVSMDSILASINRVRNFFVLMFFLVLVFIEALILFVLYITYHPIFRLLNEMKRFQNGYLQSHISYDKNDEIRFIYDCYNDMVAHINRLIKDTYEQESFKRQAEIKILQIQINQHFLYNTLEAIVWLCKKNQPEKAGSITLKLSNFYRTFLSNGMEQLPLRAVVQMLRDYADIVLVRHDNNIAIDIAVDESLLDCMVYKTIFQPILENAIIHGVEHRMAGGRIKVSFVDTGESLCYTVTDNGPGIQPDVLQKLQQMPEFSLAGPNEFFALQCIHYQMKLVYGERFTFKLESVLLQGTTATITIPKQLP